MSADSTILTREQGDALAAEVLAVIPDQQGHPPTSVQEAQWQRDRLRITADLAALHRAHDGLTAHQPDFRGRCVDHGYAECDDARRYSEFAQAASDALWRTAKPYGVYP